MIEIDALTAFFGWCSLFNIVVFLFSAIALTLLRNTTAAIHSKLFMLNRATLPESYFQYLGNYKIAILIFNLAPYIALKVMS